MNLQLVEQITKKQMRNDIPEFKAGDTLKVFVKIKEGEKFRIQLFEGVCIARKGSGISESFTVRKISYQVEDLRNQIVDGKIKVPQNEEEFKSMGYDK